MVKRIDWTKAVPVLTSRAASLFWSHVDIQPNTDVCWLWRGAKTEDGYGSFVTMFDDGVRRNRKSSRFAWSFANNRWPAFNEVVMHSCDIRLCCNPKHLSIGTNDMNMADMAVKGRASQGDAHYTRTNPEKAVRGSKVGTSKLTEQQVAQIKKRMAETPPPLLRTLADEYSVTRQLIWQIGKGKWWSHVAPAE